ncbi:hypothetical protein N6H14_12810 [Paenibacillus sp. CC-CFT747]|nr:hypothetical protein N6H14_12810 [Paenibacillus sp. CC-CFT747]
MKPTLPHAAADLGPQVLNATVHTAVPGRGPQDGHLLYAVIDGSYDADARLAVIDLNTGGVLRELPLPGAPSSWASAAAADGTIYVGSNMNGHLYRYVPGSETAEDLGLAVPDNSYVFALAAAEDGSVYGGTFPGAQLFRYHPDSGITLIGDGPLQEGEQYIRSLAWDAERDELYAGIGSHAHLVRYRPGDGSLAELLPEEAQGQFVYNLSVAAGRLFVRVTPSRTVFVLRLADPALPSGGLELESRLEEVDSFGVSLFSKERSIIRPAASSMPTNPAAQPAVRPAPPFPSTLSGSHKSGWPIRTPTPAVHWSASATAAGRPACSSTTLPPLVWSWRFRPCKSLRRFSTACAPVPTVSSIRAATSSGEPASTIPRRVLPASSAGSASPRISSASTEFCISAFTRGPRCTATIPACRGRWIREAITPACCSPFQVRTGLSP